jgi:2-(3-amino-3-carboxypropyl)histidine synthase
MEYDFEIDRIVSEIKKRKANLVGLQFPEGFKTRAIDIAREIEEKSGCTAVIFADPCYGACDTRGPEAEKLGVDVIFQFGHDEF